MEVLQIHDGQAVAGAYHDRPIMSALLSGAWSTQTGFKTDHQYDSPKAALAIWRDKPSKVRLVSDRQLLWATEGQSDAFGNILRDDARVMAKVMVERHMLTLAPAVRAAISPGQKWKMCNHVESLLTERKRRG